MIRHFQYLSKKENRIALSLYGADLADDAPCVVYLHGFKGFKDWGFAPFTGETFAAAGIRCLALNFSHNGIGDDLLNFTEEEKFKENTFSLEREEAREVVDKYANGELFDAKPGAPIGVLGHSRGGGIALLACHDMPAVKAICTWAAVSSFARYPKEIIDQWRAAGTLDVKNARTGQVLQLGWNLHQDLLNHLDGQLSIKKAVTALEKPLCVVHGDADTAVVEQDARNIFAWAENAQAEMHIIPDAGHTFGAKHPWAGSNDMFDDVLKHTLQFFKHHLIPQTKPQA